MKKSDESLLKHCLRKKAKYKVCKSVQYLTFTKEIFSKSVYFVRKVAQTGKFTKALLNDSQSVSFEHLVLLMYHLMMFL